MKRILWLLISVTFLCMLCGNSWAQYLENWHLKLDGKDVTIADFLDIRGTTWVKNEFPQGESNPGFFEEWGFFETKGHGPFSASYPFDGEITAIFYANGTVKLGDAAYLQEGWLKMYYDENNDYTATVNSTIHYGANNGDLIAEFDLIWGKTVVNGAGEPANGDSTTIWAAKDMKSGVFFDSTGRDLSTLPQYWTLGIGVTHASYLDNALYLYPDIAGELAEFAGEFLSNVNMTNIAPSDLILSNSGDFHLQVVPEPATMLLFGTGLLGFVGIGRKKFRK